MSPRPIVPSVLGPQAAASLRTEGDWLLNVVNSLDETGWEAVTPAGGASVARVIAHLAEGDARLADAWRRQLDSDEDEILLHTFDDPSVPPSVTMDTTDPAAVLAAYRRSLGAVHSALGAVRQADWAWPVWSPLGGVETLAEAVRRTVTHHLVHASDVASALGIAPPSTDDAVRLAAEFVLDALARRGGGTVPPPLVFEVVTSLPGAGTWSLIFDEERQTEVDNVYEALMGSHPEALTTHRVEQGQHPDARVTVRASGDVLLRAAFQRGADWSDLDVHGDDEAVAAWHRLIARTTEVSGEVGGLGRVAH